MKPMTDERMREIEDGAKQLMGMGTCVPWIKWVVPLIAEVRRLREESCDCTDCKHDTPENDECIRCCRGTNSLYRDGERDLFKHREAADEGPTKDALEFWEVVKQVSGSKEATDEQR